MMMNKRLLILTLLSFSLYAACRKVEKDVHNYYPKVETGTATVRPDGSVLVNATILSEGSDPVLYAGFCMDEIPEPGMLSNQQTVDTIFDNEFHTIYKNLKPFTRYYFRSFVANANGYVYGNTISLDSVTFVAPCKPAARDTMRLVGKNNSKTYKLHLSADAPKSGALDWVINIDNPEGYIIQFLFDEYPTQGIYKTTDADTYEGQYVKVIIDGPVTGYAQVPLDDGADVYIEQIDATHFELSLCDGSLSFGQGFKVEARFLCPGK